MLLNKSKEIFHKLINKITESSSIVPDYLLYRLKSNSNFKNYSAKTIVFVGDHFHPRIARFSAIIKQQSELATVLYCHQKGLSNNYSSGNFNEVVAFRNKWHLMRLLNTQSNILLIHAFAPCCKYAVVAKQTTKKPLVMDMQDVWNIYYAEDNALNWIEREKQIEHEALKIADGIIAPSLELNVAYRKLKLKKPKHVLFFPNYCNDLFFIENKKNMESEVHVVYAGGVSGLHRNAKHYGNIQFQYLINYFTEQHIHFHIYPSPSNIKADYDDYIEIAKHNNYFHFHHAVSSEKLSAELSHYHFGIIPFFKNLSGQSDLKFKYSTSLKLFNYLEAGLPIIVSEDILFQQKMVMRYNTGISITYSDLKTIKAELTQQKHEALKNNVMIARQNLSLQHNSKRLLNFYDSFS